MITLGHAAAQAETRPASEQMAAIALSELNAASEPVLSQQTVQETSTLMVELQPDAVSPLVSSAADLSSDSSPAIGSAAATPYPGQSFTRAAALTASHPEASSSVLAQADGTNTAPPASPPPGQTAPPADSTPSAPPTNTPQDTTVTPGRATRSGPSYLGVGGNFGVGSGGTDVGRTSFSVYSKIGLTRWLSFRPSVLIRNSATVLLPLTYDFSFGAGPTSDLGFRAAPFLGVGPAITTRRGGNVDLLLTGGVDIPLSSRFTATAAVNATVTGNPAVGLFVGVGYNFPGF